MWIKRWKWCDGFSTGITLPISRIEKGRSKRWPVEQNVVVGISWDGLRLSVGSLRLTPSVISHSLDLTMDIEGVTQQTIQVRCFIARSLSTDLKLFPCHAINICPTVRAFKLETAENQMDILDLFVILLLVIRRLLKAYLRTSNYNIFTHICKKSRRSLTLIFTPFSFFACWNTLS